MAIIKSGESIQEGQPKQESNVTEWDRARGIIARGLKLAAAIVGGLVYTSTKSLVLTSNTSARPFACVNHFQKVLYFTWCRRLSINLAWHLNDNFLAGVPAITLSCCFHVNIFEAKRRLRSTFSARFFSMVQLVHIFLVCITRLLGHFIKALDFGDILLSCVTLYFDLVRLLYITFISSQFLGLRCGLCRCVGFLATDLILRKKSKLRLGAD